MSLVDRHEIGMLSSVLPAPAEQASRTATPRTRGTVSPAGAVGGISGFGPLF